MTRVTDLRPAHQRVAADLRAKIMEGSITGKLPSVTRLKVEYDGAANATIQRAIETLRSEGLVYSRQGQGIYARERPPTAVRAGAYIEPNAHFVYKLLGAETVEEIPPDVALRLPSGAEPPIRRTRLLLVDDEPIELSKSYYPADIARRAGIDAPKRIPGGVPARLAAAGLPERQMIDRITSRPPTTEELEALQLPTGVSILRTFRVITSDDDQVVEVSILVKGVHMAELEYSQPAI